MHDKCRGTRSVSVWRVPIKWYIGLILILRWPHRAGFNLDSVMVIAVEIRDIVFIDDHHNHHRRHSLRVCSFLLGSHSNIIVIVNASGQFIFVRPTRRWLHRKVVAELNLEFKGSKAVSRRQFSSVVFCSVGLRCSCTSGLVWLELVLGSSSIGSRIQWLSAVD